MSEWSKARKALYDTGLFLFVIFAKKIEWMGEGVIIDLLWCLLLILIEFVSLYYTENEFYMSD